LPAGAIKSRAISGRWKFSVGLSHCTPPTDWLGRRSRRSAALCTGSIRSASCTSASKNPLENVETRSQFLYKAVVITPQQTLAILNKLTNPMHYTLVLTCAATALRASEIISLRWSDVLWSDGQIRISKRWAKGEDGETKTAASNGYVPMHPVHGPSHFQLQRMTEIGEPLGPISMLPDSPRQGCPYPVSSGAYRPATMYEPPVNHYHAAY
jgi:integrase